MGTGTHVKRNWAKLRVSGFQCIKSHGGDYSSPPTGGKLRANCVSEKRSFKASSVSSFQLLCTCGTAERPQRKYKMGTRKVKSHWVIRLEMRWLLRWKVTHKKIPHRLHTILDKAKAFMYFNKTKTSNLTEKFLASGKRK